LITGHDDVSMSVGAMKGGAVEFLLKPFRDRQLLDAIQRTCVGHQGERQRLAEIGDLGRRYNSLTRREREVMTYAPRRGCPTSKSRRGFV